MFRKNKFFVKHSRPSVCCYCCFDDFNIDFKIGLRLSKQAAEMTGLLGESSTNDAHALTKRMFNQLKVPVNEVRRTGGDGDTVNTVLL